MNDAEKNLLTLLENALHQRRWNQPLKTDWNAVFEEAKYQTVIALAASALPPGLTEEEKEPWKKAQYWQLSEYLRYMHAQDELCHLLEKHEIPMVILKGSAAAVYYPRPSLRAMGDIDFLVPPELSTQTQSLLQENGYQLLDNDERRHIEIRKNNISFELHYRFSHDTTDIESYITEGMRDIQKNSVDEHVFPMLPALANGIVLLDHMRAHLICGMGLRQWIDWLMYVESELDDGFWDDGFKAAAEEKALDILAITATRAGQKYLGLADSVTWCSGADEILCEKFVEYLLHNGNFGSKTGLENNAEKVLTIIRQKGLLYRLQFAGEHNWKMIKKYPCLRSFAWCYQIFRYFKQALEATRTGKYKAMHMLRQGNERYEFLKELKIK